jgi:Flp pilus assembly pilin Flp
MLAALIHLKQTIKRFVANRQGRSFIEYALLAGFLAVAFVVLVQSLGNGITSVFQGTGTKLADGGTGSSPAASPVPAPIPPDDPADTPADDDAGKDDGKGKGKDKKPKTGK